MGGWAAGDDYLCPSGSTTLWRRAFSILPMTPSPQAFVGRGPADRPGAFLAGSAGLFNGSIQPPEFSKLAIMIYIADWLSSKGERICRGCYGLIPFAILLGSWITGLIAATQPRALLSLDCPHRPWHVSFIAGGNLWQIIVSAILGGGIYCFDHAVGLSFEWVATFLTRLMPTAERRATICQISSLWGRGAVRPGVGGQPAKKFITFRPPIPTVFLQFWARSWAWLVPRSLGLFSFSGLSRLSGGHGWLPDAFGRVLASGITCGLISSSHCQWGGDGQHPFTGYPVPFISFGGSSLESCDGQRRAAAGRIAPDHVPKIRRKRGASRLIIRCGIGDTSTRPPGRR